MKITENLGEFQKLPDDDSKTGLCLKNTLKFIDIQRILRQFESVKAESIFQLHKASTRLQTICYKALHLLCRFLIQ